MQRRHYYCLSLKGWLYHWICEGGCSEASHISRKVRGWVRKDSRARGSQLRGERVIGRTGFAGTPAFL